MWKLPQVPPHEREQRLLKAELIMDSYALAGIDALVPGDGDFAFGLDWLLGQAQEHELPYLAANLRRDGEAIFPGRRLVEVGSTTVGVFGVSTGDLPGQLEILDPIAAARSEVSALRSEGAELIVGLAHLGQEGGHDLLEQLDGVDLLISADGASRLRGPAQVGTGLQAQLQGRGKYIGRIDIDLVEGASGLVDPDAGSRDAGRRRALENRVRDLQRRAESEQDPNTRSRLERSLAFNQQQLSELAPEPEQEAGARHQARWRQVGLSRDVDDEPRHRALLDAVLTRIEEMGGEAVDPHAGHNHGTGQQPAMVATSDGPFVGATTCRNCHLPEYQDWASTPHARAYQTLIDERRHLDFDCYSCHVTGAGQEGGPATPREVGHLASVQCEACHGPGAKHAQQPTLVDMEMPTEEGCRTCHHPDQDDGRFNYDTYLPHANHSRLRGAEPAPIPGSSHHP